MKKLVMLCLLLGFVAVAALTGCNRNGDGDHLALPTDGPILPWTGETVTFRGFGGDLGINESPDAPVATLIREMVGNVEIEWSLVPMGDRVARLNLYLHAGDVPDFFWTNGRNDIWNPGLQDSGMFLDFNNYREHMPHFNAMAATHPSALIYTNTSGELIILPSMDNDQFPHGFFYNADVLNRLGIAVPTTFAEMEAAMQAIVDADPSIIPFHTFWGMNYYKTVFSRIMDYQMPTGGIFFCIRTNQWQHSLLGDTGYYRLVSTMADFMQRGFFHPEFMTMSTDETRVIMASGNWAFTYTYGVQPNQWSGVGPRDENPVGFAPMLPPAPGPGVTAMVGLGHVSCNPIWGFAASAEVSNPAILAATLDVVWSYEVSIMYQWGVEGESFYFDAAGQRQWLPAFLDRGSEGRNQMGIWNTMLPRFVTLREDLSDHRAQAPFVQALYRMQAEAVDAGLLRAVYPPLAPAFTDEQRENNAIITTATNTVRDEFVMQMIAGIRPMSDWDAMLSAVNAAGDLNVVVNNHNTAPADPFIRPPANQRHFIRP